MNQNTLQNRKANRLARPEKVNWTLDVNNGELVTNNLIDLSPTGFSFKAPKKTSFTKGQKIKLNLKLDSHHDERDLIETHAQIVWIKDAEETTHGTSHHLGVKFLNLPAQADAAIMSRINMSLLEQRRREITEGHREPLAGQSKHEADHVFMPYFGIITASVLLAALLTASFIHERQHPEESLANRIQKAQLWQKSK